jgi:uncharacterized protein (TIGR03437 family)
MFNNRHLFLVHWRESAIACFLLASLTIPTLLADSRLLPPLPKGTVLTAIQVDSDANIYIAGSLVPKNGDVSVSDAFVAKLRSDGSQVYKTVLAGSAFESANTIALAVDGSIYVAGVTTSKDFPVTPNALQTTLGTADGQPQAFLAKLSPSGQVQSATYFGGSALTRGNAIGVTSAGEVLLTGTVSGAGFPASSGGVGAGNGFYLAKFDGAIGKVSFATLAYGGTALALDPQGNIYTAGAATPTNGFNVPLQTNPDAFQSSVQGKPCIGSGDFVLPCSYQFVEKLDPTATKLSYATFLTGSFGASPAGLAVDSAGNVIVAGATNSADYPVTPEALQSLYLANAAAPPNLSPIRSGFGPPPSSGYITKLNPTGTGLIWSTFFGGSEQDAISGVVVSSNGDIYIAGQANSNDLPGLSASVPDGCRPGVNQGLGFVARLSSDGTSLSPTRVIYGAPSCTYASCFPDTQASSSSAWALAVKPDGSIIAAGANGALAAVDLFSSSRLACMIDPADNVQITVIAPGQLLSIFGSRIVPGVSVTFNGVAAPILFAGGDQVNVQVPYEIVGHASAEMDVLNANLGLMERAAVAVQPRQPSVFLAQDALLSAVPGYFYCGNGVSRNQHALALNADGTLNSCSNGARPGSVVTIFLNGVGQTQPAQKTGATNSGPAVKVTPTATGSGVVSTTTSPGSNSGVAQVQVRAASAGFLELSPTISGIPAREPIVIWVGNR